jgi:hypothetical protein
MLKWANLKGQLIVAVDWAEHFGIIIDYAELGIAAMPSFGLCRVNPEQIDGSPIK